MAARPTTVVDIVLFRLYDCSVLTILPKKNHHHSMSIVLVVIAFFNISYSVSYLIIKPSFAINKYKGTSLFTISAPYPQALRGPSNRIRRYGGQNYKSFLDFYPFTPEIWTFSPKIWWHGICKQSLGKINIKYTVLYINADLSLLNSVLFLHTLFFAFFDFLRVFRRDR